MVTLLTSVVACGVIWSLHRRLSRTGAQAPSPTRGMHIAIVLFFVLAMIGPLLKDEGVEGRGTSTAVLFIAVPLFLIFVVRKPMRRILRPVVSRGYWGRFLAVLLLTYPLDLTVGFDAGRDLGEHMLSILGFYLGLAFALAWFYRRFAFSAHAAFVVGGLMGVLIEQNFLGPVLLVTSPIAFLAIAPMLFLTYSLYLLAPLLLLDEDLRTLDRPTASRRHAFWLFLAVCILPIVTWFATMAIFSILGLEPEVLEG